MEIKTRDGYPEIKEFLREMPDRFDCDGDVLYKGRNTVKSYISGERTLIVKRYKKPDFFKQLQWIFLHTCKGKKAFKYSNILLDNGFHTPLPLGYLVLTDGIFLKDSYFVTLPVDGEQLSMMLKGEEWKKHEDILSLLSKEIAAMHVNGIKHGDLNLSNIFLTKGGNFEFIDTNRTRTRKHPVDKKESAANIMRLSHDRALLSFFARQYARERKWDEVDFQKKVIAHLSRFERKKRILHSLKKLIK